MAKPTLTARVRFDTEQVLHMLDSDLTDGQSGATACGAKAKPHGRNAHQCSYTFVVDTQL